MGGKGLWSFSFYEDASDWSIVSHSILFMIGQLCCRKFLIRGFVSYDTSDWSFVSYGISDWLVVSKCIFDWSIVHGEISDWSIVSYEISDWSVMLYGKIFLIGGNCVDETFISSEVISSSVR